VKSTDARVGGGEQAALIRGYPALGEGLARVPLSEIGFDSTRRQFNDDAVLRGIAF